MEESPKVDMTLANTLAADIRLQVNTRRLQLGLSQVKLAEKAGVTENTIHNIERPHARTKKDGFPILPSLMTLIAIGKALGVDAADLLGAAVRYDTVAGQDIISHGDALLEES